MPHMNETIALVGKLFAGITDKGGQPYDQHCYRVAGLPGGHGLGIGARRTHLSCEREILTPTPQPAPT